MKVGIKTGFWKSGNYESVINMIYANIFIICFMFFSFITNFNISMYIFFFLGMFFNFIVIMSYRKWQKKESIKETK